MSRSSRIVAIVGTLAVLAIAFVVVSPGGDDEPAATTPTVTLPPPPATTGTTGTTTLAPRPKLAPRARYDSIVVRGGKAVGGVQRIELKKGSVARIEVSSPDTSDEIHIHGYDLMKGLRAGGRARFRFTADADGIYEIEIEQAGEQIGQLVVRP